MRDVIELGGGRKPGLLFASTLAVLCACAGSIFAYAIDSISCLNDTTAPTVAFCREPGAEVIAPLILSLVPPPALVVVAAIVGVRRRRYKPIVWAAIVLTPLPLVLDAVLWL
jgi:hypothetical protein